MYKDYYRILEIEPNASDEQISEAFATALTKIGQMKIAQFEGKFEGVDLEEVLSEVQEAKKVLSNKFTRQIFDETMYIKPTKVSLPINPIFAKTPIRKKFSYLKFIHREIVALFAFVVGFIWLSWGASYLEKLDKDEINYPITLTLMVAGVGMMYWFGRNIYQRYEEEKDA